MSLFNKDQTKLDFQDSDQHDAPDIEGSGGGGRPRRPQHGRQATAKFRKRRYIDIGISIDTGCREVGASFLRLDSCLLSWQKVNIVKTH